MTQERTRKHRIAAEIQRIVNELLISEVKDPRLSGARVSAVEVSGDLGVATVFFNTIALDDDPANVREGFEKARGFFRSRVGQALQLRRVPELRFRHDTSARRGIELGRLIDEKPGAPSHRGD
jgi:ribosome-binding factor A